MQSHRSLLANASHELRSPLARMKMAVSMLAEATPEERDKLKAEIDKNVAELDGLVEEVLLASRLDVAENPLHRDRVDLLPSPPRRRRGSARHVEGRAASTSWATSGCCAAPSATCSRTRSATAAARSRSASRRVRLRNDEFVSLEVCDRGPGVPEAMRERIFEPFFRLPGHAEQAGGVGLGLALVKQIAVRHGGSVRCEARERRRQQVRD